MADINVGSMVIEDHGSGEAVVMIHGLGGSSNSFQPLMEATIGYRSLRPDLPGAGRSALRPGRPGLGGMAKAVREVLRSSKIQRAHFIGHSMGTIICQKIAAEAPKLVTSMILFGAITEPPIAARQALKERGEKARTEGMAGIAEAVSAGSVGPDASPAVTAFVRESLLRQDPAGYAAHCDALSVSVSAHYGDILCPTTLVAGEKDTVAPVVMAQELAGKITGSSLEIVSGVAHWITLEAAEQSSDIVCKHLNKYCEKSGE